MATSLGGCRQTLKRPHAGAFTAVQSSLKTDSSSAARLDSTARRLRTALLSLSLPLAAAARAFIGCCGWKEFGYARLSDHARERLGHSARWVRDLAALNEAVNRLPGLSSALTGEDGGRPLGLVAATHIGKVASRESLPVWLSIARTKSARKLKTRVSRAVKANSSWPQAETAPTAPDPQEDGSCYQRINLLMPAAVREAFSEALDLYRAVEGHTAPVNEFIDSLIAEACSGKLAGRIQLDISNSEASVVRSAEEELSGTRGHGTTTASGDQAARRSTRRQETGSSHVEEPPSARTVDAHMRRLISLHDDLERQLSEVVTAMADAVAWRTLGYRGLDDYAQRGLGWSRSTLHNRVRLVRCLRRLPVVRQAYRQGRIGQVAARTIAGLLTSESQDGTVPLRISDATQEAWVERAATATVKRLEDESRAVTRLIVEGHGCRRPLSDLAWHASLQRHAGTTRQRVRDLAGLALTAPGPMLPLRLPLKRETAIDLNKVLAVACRDAGLVRTFSRLRSTLKATTAARPRGNSLTGVETFSPAAGPVPVWVGLLAILQEFIEAWDVDVAGRRASTQRIYIRDGWRCMAPGCSSRRNIEIHHVVYRSRGGDDRPDNLVVLCRFHHQMGEHGLLARVRGTAPMALRWSLGREGCGGTFRNELRMNS